MDKKLIFILVGVFVLIGAGALLMSSRGGNNAVSSKTPSVSVNPVELPGIQKGEAPWFPETNNLKDRLKAIGLPALSLEGTALHIHQHIDIFINGKQIDIPEGIGINEPAFISPVHTHDTTSIIHVESPTVQTFTLGQFFDIWGVLFTNDCIGGYCKGDNKSLKVYSNGKLMEGDVRNLALESHQEIVVTFGEDKSQPSPIPSSFSFPAGY